MNLLRPIQVTVSPLLNWRGFIIPLLLLANVSRSHGATGTVIISEFMASNATGILDEDGNTSDWIELYNTGAAQVNLAGWRLSDDSANLSK